MTKGKDSPIWFWIGFALMAITVVPNCILGENAIFTYHDQLDGEVIAYILQAKHLFSGDILPEFMGGMSKTALTMPAPLCVLLFFGGDACFALTVMQLAGRLAGFAGMYLLSREMVKSGWIAAVAGGLYGLLPFLPVYGLSQYGIPLLFWCALQLGRKKHLALSYCYVAVFALASSLVLAGFGLLGMGVIWFIWQSWHKKQPWHFLAAWLLMAVIYITENSRLLFQLVSGGMVSHKEEYVLDAQPFWPVFWQSLTEGGQHSYGYHGLLALAMVLALAVSLGVFRAEKKELPREIKRALECMGFCICWNLFFALAASFWDSSAGVSLRSVFGAMGAFQLDRLLWVAPCLWYLAIACGFAVLWSLWEQRAGNTMGEERKGSRLAAGGCIGVLAAASCITGVWILSAGDIKSNVQKLRNPDYGILSIGDYYAVGVMEQVQDFLAEQTGRTQEEYRVVSLGIDPAAALYHGFYCLDGYSNNYSLEYKHRFRQVIAPELEKSDYLKAYFDGWGNRCYLFSAECPGYYTIGKTGFYFQDYQLDTAALREMGGCYLLSAAYIQNAESQGLMLMNDIPFETEGSYYRIFVYEIKGEGKRVDW